MKRVNLFVSVAVVCLFLTVVVNYVYNKKSAVPIWTKPWTLERYSKTTPRLFLNHTVTTKKVYNITWYNPPIDFFWPAAIYGGFKSCKYSNCLMKFDKKTANQSDAVLFNGRSVKPEDYFVRKAAQVWIYATIEAPTYLWVHGNYWTEGRWVSSFNWTMTYDRSNSDIFLPYGEIKEKQGPMMSRNYSEIFRSKNKTALIVHSNCKTPSKREIFVKQLGKYIEIESFGYCGKPWNCGQIYKHDDCFRIINKYKFYLAFENSFCNEYFTEKIFRNFNYDSLMVIRGGRKNDTKRIFPDGTYISTEDYRTAKELGQYLNNVANSEEMYTTFLKRKDQFYSIPYERVYKRAMCQICEHMNKQDVYRKQIRNITEWAYGRKPCQPAHDIEET